MAQTGWVLPRLAIGASWNPTVFDGTAILSLCYGDQDVSPPLTWMKLTPMIVPSHDIRQVASLTAPRAFMRTGYGARLQFDIELAYDTNQLPGIGRGFSGSVSGADISLDSLASIFSRSAGGLALSAGTAFPPYLFLTTTFQTAFEQWIPCEIDVNDPLQGQVYAYKTFTRTMQFSLSSRQTYQRIIGRYAGRPTTGFPSGLASIGAPGGGPPYSGTVTLSAPLAANLVNSDYLLVLFNSFSYFLFLITAINPARTTITVQTSQVWPGAISNTTYRTLGADTTYVMPFWTFDAFAGSVPLTQSPNLPAFTNIIGAI